MASTKSEICPKCGGHKQHQSFECDECYHKNIPRIQQRGINLTGKRFGNLVAIERVETPAHIKKHGARWLCKCDCGNEKEFRSETLTHLRTTHCGCLKLHAKPIKGNDYIGKKYNKLTIIDYAGNGKYNCKCDCGKYIKVQFGSIINGRTKSCKDCIIGSGRNPFKGNSNVSHLYNHYQSQATQGWKGRRKIDFELTKEEFYNLSISNCHYCGGKPEQSCNSKNKYEPFIHNGIDRIDSFKGYTADNCVPCCKHCNWAKNSKTQDEFITHIEKIHAHIHRNDNQGKQANDSQYKTNGASESKVGITQLEKSQVIAEIGCPAHILNYQI